MVFALYDAATDGGQIGNRITNSAALANGLFTVNLDFGAGAFNGSARWLDITVQCGTNDAENLTPRVLVLASPYALFANTAGTANTASNLNVNGGSVTLTKGFPPFGISSWNIQNDFYSLVTNSTMNGNSTNFQGVFSFVGGSGLPALQIWDDPQYGTQGVSSSTFIGGTFPGDGSGLTNLPPHGITNFEAGTYAFTVPAGVTQLSIKHGEEAGSDGTSSFQTGTNYFGKPTFSLEYGGGGGAGGYARGFIKVTPLQSYNVVVGAAGVRGVNVLSGGSGTDGTAGGDTFFDTVTDAAPTNGALFLCRGGQGGAVGTESDLANGFLYGEGGAGGAAEPFAGIQRTGTPGAGGDNNSPGIGQAGTLQRFGGTFYGYGGGAGGGCIVIQW